jgi:hypothetical protein
VDRGSQTYPIDFQQKAHWYRRPFLWSLDMIVQNLWLIVSRHSKDDGGNGARVCFCKAPDPGGKTLGGDPEQGHRCYANIKGLSGRRKFQAELGEDLICYAAQMLKKEVVQGSPAADPSPKAGPTGGRPKKRPAARDDGAVAFTLDTEAKPTPRTAPKRPAKANRNSQAAAKGLVNRGGRPRKHVIEDILSRRRLATPAVRG